MVDFARNYAAVWQTKDGEIHTYRAFVSPQDATDWFFKESGEAENAVWFEVRYSRDPRTRAREYREG